MVRRRRTVRGEADDELQATHTRSAQGTRFTLDLENDYWGYTLDMSNDQVRMDFRARFGEQPERVFRTGAAVYAGPIPEGGREW